MLATDRATGETSQKPVTLEKDEGNRPDTSLEGLAGLKPAQRELLDRCYAGAESIRKIAGQRGEPPNALYMTLKRLRRALFDCINLTLTTQGTA